MKASNRCSADAPLTGILLSKVGAHGLRSPFSYTRVTSVVYMSAPPTLTDDQRREALAKAAVARRVRAELKERLKMGSLSLPELLAQVDDPIIGRTKVLAVLESLPGVGKVKARKLMLECRISDTRRLRGLGEVQRATLLETLG